MARYREIGVVPGRGLALSWLVYAAGEQDDTLRAMAYARELWEISNEAQDRRLLYLCGAGVTWLLREQGDPEQLAQLLGAMRQLREMMGIDLGRIIHTHRVITIAAEALKARLGQEAFAAALAEGRSLTFSDMATLTGEVLRDAGRGGAPKATQETRQTSLLSPREHEVLRLVAEGLTSKQIGEQLFLSYRTIDHHVTAIFNKLGVESRA